jgi:hypothetical protein
MIEGALTIFYIAIWGYILLYIAKLEKLGCKCSKNWQREFIKYYIIFMLLIFIIRLFDSSSPYNLPPILMTIQFVLTIVFVGIVYHYIMNLKQKNCKCSNDTARDILEIINYIQIFLIVLGLLIMIHVIFTIANTNHKLKYYKSVSQKRI